MFDEMISKKLIEVIWVLASIGVVINGIVLMIAGEGGWSFFLALIFIAIGLLVVRVYCELMIVIFKINENLQQSTFALEEIHRYQPKILSKLTDQLAHSTNSASASTPQFAHATAPQARGVGTGTAKAVHKSTAESISTPSTRGNWSGYSDSSDS